MPAILADPVGVQASQGLIWGLEEQAEACAEGLSPPDPVSERHWLHDPRKAGEVARRARQFVLSRLRRRPASGSPLPAHFLSGLLDWVFVTVYFKGRLRGCIGSVVGELEEVLHSLARSALKDARFGEVSVPADDSQVAVTVSLLCNICQLGTLSSNEAAQQLERADQGLMVRQGRRAGLLLPHVASHSNLDRQEYVEHVIRKAGLMGPPFEWQRFDCTTWMALQGQDPQPLENGFPVKHAQGDAIERAPQLTAMVAAYLLRNQRPDGSFWTRYHPVHDTLFERRSLSLAAGAAWPLARAGRVLQRADLIEASRRSVRLLLDSLQGDSQASEVNTSAKLLLALCELAAADGSWQKPSRRIAQGLCDQLAGQTGCAIAVLALTMAAPAGLVDQQWLSTALLKLDAPCHPVDLTALCWRIQACFGGWMANPDPRLAMELKKCAEQILEWLPILSKHKKACLAMALAAQGLAPALRLALRQGEEDLARRCSEACRRLLEGLDRLILQKGDCALLPNPGWAVGGVRSGINRSEILTHEVQLALAALLALDESIRGKPTNWRENQVSFS